MSVEDRVGQQIVAALDGRRISKSINVARVDPKNIFEDRHEIFSSNRLAERQPDLVGPKNSQIESSSFRLLSNSSGVALYSNGVEGRLGGLDARLVESGGRRRRQSQTTLRNVLEPVGTCVE